MEHLVHARYHVKTLCVSFKKTLKFLIKKFGLDVFVLFYV